MKFTKFIPLMCAMALTVPVFATENEVQTEFTLTVPEYFNITQESQVLTATGTITENASTGAVTLSYTTPMAVQYRVVNNTVNKNVYIQAKTGSGSYNALGGAFGSGETPSTLKVVFAMDDVAETAVTSARGADPQVAENPKAIAFALTPGAIVTDAGSIADPVLDTGKIKYVCQPGTFHIPYSFGTSAVSGTFSMADPQGAYKAKLIITDTPT